jgi:hypothetical protein
MDMAPADIASRLSTIRETLAKLQKSIDDGLLQDALRHALRLSLLTNQMASEWCGNAREPHLRAVIAQVANTAQAANTAPAEIPDPELTCANDVCFPGSVAET